MSARSAETISKLRDDMTTARSHGESREWKCLKCNVYDVTADGNVEYLKSAWIDLSQHLAINISTNIWHVVGIVSCSFGWICAIRPPPRTAEAYCFRMSAYLRGCKDIV